MRGDPVFAVLGEVYERRTVPRKGPWKDKERAGWMVKSPTTGEVEIPLRCCPKCFKKFYSESDFVRETFPAVPDKEIRFVTYKDNVHIEDSLKKVQHTFNFSVEVQLRRHDGCTGVMADFGTVLEEALPTPKQMARDLELAEMRGEEEMVQRVTTKILAREAGLTLIEGGNDEEI